MEEVPEPFHSTRDGIFSEPLLRAINEKEPQSLSCSASPAPMTNKETFAQDILDPNTPEASNSESPRDFTADDDEEKDGASLKRFEEMSQSFDNEEIDPMQAMIEDELEIDSDTSETDKSMKDEPSDEKLDATKTKLNLNDQIYNAVESSANVELTHERELRRPHKSPLDCPQPKRRRIAHSSNGLCCSYQKNYVHVKGQTIHLEIG